VGALTLQLVGFCWFIGTAIFYYGECVKNVDSVFDIQQGYSYVTASGSSLSFKDVFFSFVLRAELLLPYLSIAYLILITCLSFKIVRAYKNTQTLRYQGLQKIDVNWRLFVNQISNQLGIKRNVRLYISTLIESPVTIGFLKPLILLPAAVVNNLSTEQIEAILIHEMAHIKRNDYLINILISIVEVTLFFNPFMQLVSKQMKRERENSCDDWVLQYEYNACTYAKALLKIATYKTTDTTNFAVNAVDNRRALLIRVKRMIEKKDLYNTYRQQLVSLIFITATISSLAWFAPKKYPVTNQVQKTTSVKLLVEPLVAKVENPLFNPVFFLAEDNRKEIKTALLKAETVIIDSMEIVAKVPVLKEVETEIVDQFVPSKTFKESQPKTKEAHAVNLVLDSALFKTYATRSLVIAEIKKLKKEFEELNKSSLFQNVDWKQFWDNTKVQKQLETAFEQLKALETQQKKQNFTYTTTAVKKTTADCADGTIHDQAQLKMLASKKLATIVKDRITDIKNQQSGSAKTTELNFNFDLPDFTNLNIVKDNEPWSYTYQQKPRTALKITVPKPTSSCKDSKEKTSTRLVEKKEHVLIENEVPEERIRRVPVTRTLKVVRI
jgi:beta-lactamase regulating signal transducer with metallopeptidase domain